MTEEEKLPAAAQQQKPGFWQQALRTIKGDSTETLVEQFTAEMTLVAEGLYEDQNRVSRELEKLSDRVERLDTEGVNERDRMLTELRSEIETIETDARRSTESLEKRLTGLERRLNVLEKAQEKAREQKNEKPKKTGILQSATLIAGICGGSWVLVTLLELIRTLVSK